MSRLAIEPATARRLGLSGPELRLRRAWPRSPDHVLLDLHDDGGRAIAGQWMRDGRELEQVLAETKERCPGPPLAIVEGPRGSVLLQPRGADRILPALHRILSRPAARLLAHRPERRGVVRLAGDVPERSRYVKVVAAGRVERLTAPLLLLRERHLEFRLPQLLEAQPDDGQVTFAALTGRSLHDLLTDPGGLVAAAGKAGRALRSLHAATGLPLRRHGPSRVAKELRRRVFHLASLEPPLAQRLDAALNPVIEALQAACAVLVPVHRDFHDKQVVVQEDGAIGVLDFDTLSLGEPALDVANALAHFELRSLQGLCTPATARETSRAFLEGYAVEDETAARLQAYLDATRLRLACLYALRPAWRPIPDLLITRLGRTGPGAAGAAWS
jgi:hypothetical protein